LQNQNNSLSMELSSLRETLDLKEMELVQFEVKEKEKG
jgi:hypothetical protein